ncbi:MAG: SDR family oxidoreductase [Cytophagales bacterium]|nr:SDR family oxidoreductase [Bernardetiaceae bacterium]MDW8209717.1 SDR family oxidoreductase [Cytophagales bacterium]
MKGKVVIITGASSGIGKALAQVFGRNGSDLVITGRNKEALEETAEHLRQQGIRVVAVQADVTRPADNERMARAALEAFGKIDVLINNAGISMRALFEEVDLEVVKKVMDINFYGALYATKVCLPYIIASKGSVVGISSIAGYRGLPGRTGYSASKFALQGFLEVLRTEMIPHGVHVLTACPGFTTSNIRARSLTKDGTPQGESPRDESKMMSAEECAEHIYKAVVKRKKILILTTLGKFTVFMNKWFPTLMDKIVIKYMAKEAGAPLKG